jgi:hypothetical protein
LGVNLKKPALSILVKAFVVNADDGGLCFSLLGPHEMPSFVASNQFFQSLVCRDENTPAFIEVTVLTYSVDPSCLLQVGFVSTGASVKVEHTRARKPTQKVTLPFGLTLPKRTRNPRQAAKSRSAKQIHQSWQLSGGGTSNVDSDAEAVLSSSNSSSTSTSSSSSSSTDIDHDPEKETEEVHPPTETAAREGASVEEVNREIEVERDLREVIGAEIQAGRPITSTYFARRIGLAEAVITPRARGRPAKCMHCEKIIVEGSVRFCYYFSPVRPSRWLHTDCVVSCVRASTSEPLKVQVSQRISQIIMMNEGPAAVVAAAESIQRVFFAGGSSSSSSSR